MSARLQPGSYVEISFEINSFLVSNNRKLMELSIRLTRVLIKIDRRPVLIAPPVPTLLKYLFLRGWARLIFRGQIEVVAQNLPNARRQFRVVLLLRLPQ